MRYGLEFTHCPLPDGVDWADLTWSPVRGLAFASELEAQEYADEATADSDGELVFRTVPFVANRERPGLAKANAQLARKRGVTLRRRAQSA